MNQLLQEDAVGKGSLLDYIVILIKQIKLIIIITLTISLLSIIYSLTLPKIYQSTATFLPPQRSSSSMSNVMAQLNQMTAAFGLPSALPGGTGNTIELYVALLRSRTIADAMVERFKLVEYFSVKKREAARKRFSRALNVQVDKRSGIISIHVEDKNPQKACDMANALIEELSKVVRHLLVTDATQKRLFFEGQLKEAHLALSSAEDALRSFQEKTGAVRIEGQTQAAFEGIAKVRAQVAVKEIQLKVMKTYATPYNREVKQQEEELAALKEQLKKLEAGGGDSYGSATIPTEEIPKLAVEYLRKMREFKFQEALYNSLLTQYESARMEEANDMSNLQVIDSAVIPVEATKPNRRSMVVFATVFGLFLGILYSLGMDYAIKTYNNPANFERFDLIADCLQSNIKLSIIAKLHRFLKREHVKR